MIRILPVVLSGGAGTRLWPASVSMYPKQLLPLVSGESTMLQDTVQRLDGVDNVADEVLVICNENHRFLVAEQLLAAGRSARVLLEPEGRNTAPAVALGAFLESENGGDAVLLVMPADHVIPDVEAFRAALEIGLGPARDGKLVTFGIVPTKAETGYGYIRAIPKGAAAVPVESFVEKPDSDTAKTYVDSGEYFWNSGMFLFRADAYLDALEQFAPEMHACCQKSIKQRQTDGNFVRPGIDDFLRSPSDSIDYAVMEKLEGFEVIPAGFEWHDLGSWDAWGPLAKALPGDNRGDAELAAIDARGNIVRGTDRLVALIGVDDLVVVDTPDALLVCLKEDAQRIKEMIDHLAQSGHDEVL